MRGIIVSIIVTALQDPQTIRVVLQTYVLVGKILIGNSWMGKSGNKFLLEVLL